jgi:adenosylhomocysteine nucleosidase
LNPRFVVIISAEGEWRAVPKIFPDAEYKEHPYGQYTELEMNGEPIILMHGGWAKVQSAASTQYAIDRWKPKLIVNIGTCGGFRGHIERNQIVMPDKAVVYDIISQIGDPDEHFQFFTTEIDNSWIKKPYPIQVETGTIVSGDRDLQPEDIPMLNEKFGARCGDWESGGIAFVCARNKTKLLILRGVSDLVGPEGGEAYDGTKVIWIEAAERIMRRIIASLPDWLSRYQE